jgi:hypothetical protein
MNKEWLKENAGEMVGVIAGIVLGLLIVINSIWGLVGLFLIMYIYAPCLCFYFMKEFVETEDWICFLVSVMSIGWFVTVTIDLMQALGY